MQDVKTYLSTAPVVATIWFAILAGLLIEINRFFPRCFSSSICVKIFTYEIRL